MKLIKICIVLVLLGCTASGLQAHSPDEISLGFSQETGVLTVNVSHMVGNIETHYVEKVTVYLNKNRVVEQQFMTQKDKEGQKAIYYIPGVKPEDTLRIETECSFSGSETKEISIKKLIKWEEELKKEKMEQKEEKESK
ncbi:MAG: hypothetical protein ACQESB_04875 [Elusimicrobiota bacterium]